MSLRYLEVILGEIKAVLISAFVANSLSPTTIYVLNCIELSSCSSHRKSASRVSIAAALVHQGTGTDTSTFLWINVVEERRPSINDDIIGYRVDIIDILVSWWYGLSGHT